MNTGSAARTAVLRAVGELDKEQRDADPVINVDLTFNVGADRQMRMVTHIPQSATIGDQNAILDRMIRLTERQRAKCDLADLERQLFNGNAEADRIRALQTDDIERLTKETDSYDAQYKARYAEEMRRHGESGRRIDYRPQKGGVVEKLEAAGADARTKIKELTAKLAEGDAARESEVAKKQRQIEAKKAEIERLGQDE